MTAEETTTPAPVCPHEERFKALEDAQYKTEFRARLLAIGLLLTTTLVVAMIIQAVMKALT